MKEIQIIVGTTIFWLIVFVIANIGGGFEKEKNFYNFGYSDCKAGVINQKYIKIEKPPHCNGE